MHGIKYCFAHFIFYDIHENASIVHLSLHLRQMIKSEFKMKWESMRYVILSLYWLIFLNYNGRVRVGKQILYVVYFFICPMMVEKYYNIW